jgi:glycerophosphoryl diester phosphodiesterase
VSDGRDRLLVIAHRGASGQRPENTLPAYELAVEQRADMIEIDLHRTRDGAIVITHDESLVALGGRGEIADATRAEVRALDAGEGECVPVLDEVLDRFGSHIPFNLELKCGRGGPYPGLERAALDAVIARDLLARTLFSSFSDRVLATLRELAPEVRIGVLVSPRAPLGWRERARAIGAEAVHLWAGLASADAVETAHADGLRVHVYTVDDPQQQRVLAERGVDGIFTNYPDRLHGLR